MTLVDRAKQALWKKSGLQPKGTSGYVADARMNLVPGVTVDMIKGDYVKGSGQEWITKFRAIHSSAALAANTFGRWKSAPSGLTFAGESGFAPPALEAKCPSGLRGTPPNLDVLLESADVVFGIESKLSEPLSPTIPKFSSSYTKERLPHCEDVWWSLLERVRQWPPSHLDAAQLIKHYLGLRNRFTDRKRIVLVYLFWKPLNASAFDEYSRLADDLAKFSDAVRSAESARFMSMDYLHLWDAWENDSNMAEHAKNLKKRYCVEI